MAAGTGRRRVLLLFAVLAGLFLMHGVGVGGCHGSAGQMVMAGSVGAPAGPVASMGSMASVAPTANGPAVAQPAANGPAVAQPAADVPGSVTEHVHAGDTCVPLRPEGLSGLFLALFLIVIALWPSRPPNHVRRWRTAWPHGPPRTGVQILYSLSICRT